MALPLCLRAVSIALVAALLYCVPMTTLGQQETPRQRSGRAAGLVPKSRVTPHWFADNTHFWYRNDLAGGAREFIVVDAVNGVRRSAFDHARLAESLGNAGVENPRADRLPIEQLAFDLPANAATFRLAGDFWRCDLATYVLNRIEGGATAEEAAGLPAYAPDGAPRASFGQGPETSITFVNQTEGEVELFWLDTEGERRGYGKIEPGRRHDQHTYASHVWEVVGGEGATLAVFVAEEEAAEAAITGKTVAYRERRGGRPGRGRPGASTPARRDRSADGKWTAFVRDHNVFVRAEEDGTEVQLSTDGVAGRGYDMLEWAPDSMTLAAMRVEPGEEKLAHLIESSPKGGGRATTRSHAYPLPGDKFASHELNLFDVVGKKQIKPQVDPVDFGRPRLRWNRDGRRFTYEKTDRGHQRFRVIEVDSHTGDARTLLDESSNTFVWTAHGPNLRTVTYLEQSDELIAALERDGWRHLYLVDMTTATITHQITQGPWVVRGIERIDEENRQVWFQASGVDPDQDPYLLHFFRVNFDGTGLVALTSGNGTHTVNYSPDRKFIIDTYSRVDLAPVHELRRVSDGTLVCELEKADAEPLRADGWDPPEVFSAKGRDGQTDIWGIICRPRDFDPAKRYPIIEDIYAGPHDSHVPKSFSPSTRYRSLTELGFIVVKIDGMGTANRSKAFHDVCWKNLKDAGFPDRICWMRAAAAKYPHMDISRVGIYGVSAGGQNAAGAVLFHGDFYKAAVASCGCHDNRMDKASWNEQWMGYPVGPHYAECSNIDNAHRLRGKLLLIVGELDTNVPPESTMRFVDALIKAGKDFDLLVIPGAGHSDGGAYGQRRLRDFFVRHLQGIEPPDRNKE